MAMTEHSFTRDICPDVIRITLDAHVSKASIVHIPYWAKRVTVRPEGKKCRISFVEGTGDNINDDFIKLPADAPAEFTFWDGENASNGINKVYIANVSSVSGATAVSIMIEGAK
jgi:hypothetical protein